MQQPKNITGKEFGIPRPPYRQRFGTVHQEVQFGTFYFFILMKLKRTVFNVQTFFVYKITDVGVFRTGQVESEEVVQERAVFRGVDLVRAPGEDVLARNPDRTRKQKQIEGHRYGGILFLFSTIST